jgi:hypothetical protein
MRSRDDGIKILGPFLQRLAQCIAQAWRDLEQIPAMIRADMSPRSRAAMVNDRIVVHARREFERDPSVAFTRGRGGLFLLAIRGSFLLRFKKLDAKLRSRNIPTTQASLFEQQHSLELPGMPPAMTHLNAGYILNRMQTEIAATYVTCPVGKRIEWSVDLASVSFGDVVTMPPRTKVRKSRTTIVPKVTETPKRTTEQKSEGAGDGSDDDNDGDHTNTKR